jgi:hypothetical protein
LKIFSLCHQCQRHRWCTLSCEYLREFSKKFETALICSAETDSWKKHCRRKSHGTVPLKAPLESGHSNDSV